MKFKNFLIVILITLFAQEIAIAKPLPPGTGASAPANILIMLDRTYSMFDPLSGKDNKKTGLGLGIFIGKTLLEKNSAKITIRNSETRGGAEVKIEWENKNLKKLV